MREYCHFFQILHNFKTITGVGGGLPLTILQTNKVAALLEYKKHSKKSWISYFYVAIEFEHDKNTLICWLSSQPEIHPDSRKHLYRIFGPEILVNCC